MSSTQIPALPAAAHAAPTRAELAAALHRGDISVALQPQMDLCSGRVVGVEALARWERIGRGSVSPLVFVPLAESSGLSDALSDAVLEQALRCLDALDALDAGCLNVAVNVSAHSVLDRRIVTRVGERLAESGARPHRLTLEVTEDALSGDFAAAQSVLGHLKSLGVRLSLDDFGTGYSSLGRLQSFPLDEVKIDRTFIEQMRRSGDTGVIAAIAALGRHLGMTVVAEGAETSSELNTLAGLGCHVAQGYVVSEPLAPDRFYEWLGRHLAIPRTVSARPTPVAAQPTDTRRPGSAELGLRLHQALDQTMTDGDDLRQICHATASRLAGLLEADFAAWWQRDPDAGPQASLRCVSVWSSEQVDASTLERMTRTMTFAPGVGLPGRVVESDGPLWVEDLTVFPSLLRVEALREAGLTQALAIPVRNVDGALGVVELFGTRMRQPNRRTMSTLASIGVRLANFLIRREAIASAATYRRTIGELEEALQRLAIAPIEQLPALVCREAEALAGADVVALWVPGSAPNELVLAASTGGVPREPRTNMLTEHSGIAAAFTSEAPLFVPDTTEHAVPSRRLAREAGARSALFQPIPGGRRSSAVLSIAWTRPTPTVSPALSAALGLLAEFVGASLSR